MNGWLAQAATPTTSGVSGKDLLVLLPPLATVLAAGIGGVFVLRNIAKSPYDRLDLLIKARSSWPDGVVGAETVDRSIAFILAQIRFAERDFKRPVFDASEHEYDQRALIRLITVRSAFVLFTTSLVMLAFIGVAYARNSTLASIALVISLFVNGGMTIYAVSTMLLPALFQKLRLRRLARLQDLAQPNSDNRTGLVFDY